MDHQKRYWRGWGGEGEVHLKKYLCKGKSYEKKYAHQVFLKNIPKIQCKGNNNEKNSCGSKKSPPPKGLSLIFFFSRKCHRNTSFLSLIYVFKNVKQGDTRYIHVWFSCLIAVLIYNSFENEEMIIAMNAIYAIA